MQKSLLSIVFGVSLFFPSVLAATSPWPTEPDIVATCSRWIEALPGDDCNVLAEIDGVPLASFLLWNPALARDCSAIKVGFGYCTENNGVITTTTSRSTLTTSAGGTVCPTVSCPVTLTVTTTVFVTLGTTTTTRSTTTTPTTTTTRSTTPLTTTTTRSTTPSTTTTTTTTRTLNVSMFPSASGTAQCVASASPIPSPRQISSGTTLDAVIVQACNTLVTTTSKFLEIGDPYTVVLPVSGVQTTFLLNIKLGGFAVPNSMCLTQLRLLITRCSFTASGASVTFGGCTYTSDFNLLACIFPP